MTRSTRLARVFVVLAIVSLASIAVAPRGVVRAAVADDLELTVDAAGAPAIDVPADEVQLPGVRAVVSREEQDPESVVDALATIPLPDAPRPTGDAPSGALDRAAPSPAADAPASTDGSRAPPRSI